MKVDRQVEAAGAKTQLTGVVGALAVALLLVVAPNLLQYLPSSALAAVVIAAAIGLFEFADLARIFRINNELFGEVSWFQVMFGQGIHPQGYHPIADGKSQEMVLKMLAEGNSVKEVACDLNLSVKTVEAHKFNLMRKLDIHNKAQLVQYAIQKKIIKIPNLA